MSDADLAALVQAVTEAEQMTSAEIRVHLDHRCQGDALARAVKLFERLDMHRTRLRNGVLIYVAVEDRKLAVIGDTGIHEHVGGTFWQRLVAATLDHLRQARPRDGLVEAVRDVGAVLRVHFPRDPEDRNELSDEVSFT